MLNKFFFQLATPRITDTRSRRLPVGDSPYQQYAESTTQRLNDMGSGDSPCQRYAESTTLCIIDTAIFLSKNSIADSPYQWCGSRRLRVSVMRRVVDFPYRWDGESPTPRIVDTESRPLPPPRIVESGSRFSNTNISENLKLKSERL